MTQVTISAISDDNLRTILSYVGRPDMTRCVSRRFRDRSDEVMEDLAKECLSNPTIRPYAQLREIGPHPRFNPNIHQIIDNICKDARAFQIVPTKEFSTESFTQTILQINSAQKDLDLTKVYSQLGPAVHGPTFTGPTAQRAAAIRVWMEANQAILNEVNILDISDLNLTTIPSEVALCRNLKTLYLSRNRISDLSPLGSLTKLRGLYLGNNQISDLRSLVSLTKLSYLHLDHNQISDLSPLRSLINLEQLLVGYNQISDLRPLGSLTQLRTLRLNDNQISDLQPLDSLTSLRDLFLSRNQIFDLQPLSFLIYLEALALPGNQISDLSALSSLIRLRYLDLRGNHIIDFAPISHMELSGSFKLSPQSPQ